MQARRGVEQPVAARPGHGAIGPVVHRKHHHAAATTFGVAIGKLPKKAEAFAALAGTLAVVL